MFKKGIFGAVREILLFRVSSETGHLKMFETSEYTDFDMNVKLLTLSFLKLETGGTLFSTAPSGRENPVKDKSSCRSPSSSNKDKSLSEAKLHSICMEES